MVFHTNFMPWVPGNFLARATNESGVGKKTLVFLQISRVLKMIACRHIVT